MAKFVSTLAFTPKTRGVSGLQQVLKQFEVNRQSFMTEITSAITMKILFVITYCAIWICLQNFDAAVHMKHIESRLTTTDKITDSTAEDYQLEYIVILECGSKQCLNCIAESIWECCTTVQVLPSNQQGMRKKLLSLMLLMLWSDAIGFLVIMLTLETCKPVQTNQSSLMHYSIV